MCDTTPRADWTSIGSSNWNGNLIVIQRCPDCLEHRGIQFDPNDIDVLKAADLDSSHAMGDHRQPQDQDDTSRDITDGNTTNEVGDGTDDDDGDDSGPEWMITE